MLGRLLGFSGQIVLVLGLTAAVGFTAAVSLTLAKFSDALSDTVEARYALHASDLRTTIETGLNLGLDLSEIADNVAVAVRDRIALDPGIMRIAVTGADGSTVFAIDREGTGTASHPRQDTAHSESRPVVNSFGAVEGHVTVMHDATADAAVIRNAARLLLRDVALLVGGVVAIGALATPVLLAPLLRDMRRAQAILAPIDPDGDPAPQQAPDGELARAATEARDAATRAQDALEAIATDLDRAAARAKG